MPDLGVLLRLLFTTLNARIMEYCSALPAPTQLEPFEFARQIMEACLLRDVSRLRLRQLLEGIA
jgi:hypothetical protein